MHKLSSLTSLLCTMVLGCFVSDDSAGNTTETTDSVDEVSGESTSGSDDTDATATSTNSSATSESETQTGDDSDFTEDGCYKWFEQMALQDAITVYDCVEVQSGTWLLDAGVALAPGKSLRGVGAAASILKADPTTWTFGCCDAVISDTIPADPATNPYHVSNLTIDGSGVATYDVCCRGYEVENTILLNARCSGLGAVGQGVVARGNVLTNNGQPTDIPSQGGMITCATGGGGGVLEGAGIYVEGPGDIGPVIEDNAIEGSFGPALDVNGAWGGVFSGNMVVENAGWAAVSLYGASGWTIANNSISHPYGEPPQPYHPYCATGPEGGHSAGIFLCQDTDANGLTTTGNLIKDNSSSSFYGILSVGADEVQPYWAPRNNTFTNNDVIGSMVGCADDFAPGQWLNDANAWAANNCQGTPNTGPTVF